MLDAILFPIIKSLEESHLPPDDEGAGVPPDPLLAPDPDHLGAGQHHLDIDTDM